MLDASEVKLWRSQYVSDDPAYNGGGPNLIAEIVSGQLYNVFPRVAYTERVAGVTRFRKIFVGFRVARSSETLFNLTVAPIAHIGGGDHFYTLLASSFDDLQVDLGNLGDNILFGPCRVRVDAMVGSSTIMVAAESDSIWFPHGQLCAFSSDTDLTGLFFVRTANVNLTTSLSITTSTTIALLSFSFMSSIPQIIEAGTVSVTYRLSGDSFVAHDTFTHSTAGTLVGPHIISSSIDYTSGLLSIEFDSALDVGTEVTASAYQRCFERSGTNYAIYFQDGLQRSVSSGEFFAACYELGDVVPRVELVSFSSSSGTITNWSVDFSDGVNYDSLTLVSLGGLSFSYTTGSGSSGSFSVTSDVELYIYSTMSYAIKFPQTAFQGSFAVGDSWTFQLYPAMVPLWIVEEVPAGTGRSPANTLILALIFE